MSGSCGGQSGLVFPLTSPGLPIKMWFFLIPSLTPSGFRETHPAPHNSLRAPKSPGQHALPSLSGLLSPSLAKSAAVQGCWLPPGWAWDLRFSFKERWHSRNYNSVGWNRPKAIPLPPAPHTRWWFLVCSRSTRVWTKNLHYTTRRVLVAQTPNIGRGTLQNIRRTLPLPESRRSVGKRCEASSKKLGPLFRNDPSVCSPLARGQKVVGPWTWETLSPDVHSKYLHIPLLLPPPLRTPSQRLTPPGTQK